MKKIEKNKKISVVKSLTEMLFILSLIFLVFPNRINAESGTIEIECEENTLKSGQTAQCYIKCKNITSNIFTFQAKLTLSDSIPLTTITQDPAWDGTCNTNGKIYLYLNNDISKSGNFNIASFKFQVPSSVNRITITLDDFIVGENDNYERVPFPKVEKTFNISSGTGNNEPSNETTTTKANITPTTTKANITPTTTKANITPTTTKANENNHNVDNNPKTGFSPLYIVIILIVTMSSLVILVRKEYDNKNE